MASLISVENTAFGAAYGLSSDYLDTPWDISIYDAASYIYTLVGNNQFGLVPDVTDALIAAFGARLQSSISKTLTVDDVADMTCITLPNIQKVITGETSDTCISTRLATIILQSMLLPGYRIVTGNGSTLEWICEKAVGAAGADGAAGSVSEIYTSAAETAVRAWLRNYATDAKTPHDIAMTVSYSCRTAGEVVDGNNLWSPPRPPKKGDILVSGSDTSLVKTGDVPNLFPPITPSINIIGPTDDLFNMPVMGPFIVTLEAIANATAGTGANANVTDTIALNRRWVSALFSDDPLQYYSSVIESGNVTVTRDAFIPSSTSNVSAGFQFEEFWNNVLETIPTMRQMLGIYLGFKIQT
jgi:hypothetical protein